MEDERIIAGLHCGEVLADLSEYLDGRLSPERAQRIDEHLQDCEGCRRLGDEIVAVARTLRELPEEPLPPEVERRLLAGIGPEKPASHG